MVVFGFVIVRVRVDRAVVVLVRVLVTDGLLMLVLMIVVGVTVFVRMLDAVHVLVGMLMFFRHGARFGPRAAAALLCERQQRTAPLRAVRRAGVVREPRGRTGS